MFGFFGGAAIGEATLINPQTIVNTTADPTGKTVTCTWSVSGNVADFTMNIEIALNSGGAYFSPGTVPYDPYLGTIQIDLTSYIGLFETAQDYNFKFTLRNSVFVNAANSPVIRFPPYSTS